jgi:hypothetical protein
MRTSGDLIPFVDKWVNVRLEDGRAGCGMLRHWQMQGPREYPFVLDPTEPQDLGWGHNRRFFAREIVEIELVAATPSQSTVG